MINAHLIEGEALAVARPTGILDATMAKELVSFVEAKETEQEGGFNRFCDLRLLTGIPLSFADLMRLTDRRSAFNPNAVHVKSAFLATDPLAFGIARMYQIVLQSPRIEVRVFNNLEAAADWLGVSPEKLKA